MTLDLNELENPTPSKSLDPPTPPLTTNEKRVLENIAHRILLLELGDNPGFIDLLTTVYAIGYKSLIAKCFEMKTEKSLDILKFRMDIYNVSAAFKSAHFILFAPLAGAISLVNKTINFLWQLWLIFVRKILFLGGIHRSSCLCQSARNGNSYCDHVPNPRGHDELLWD